MTQPFDARQDLIDAPNVGSRMRPKDAATLIVVRRDGPEPRVLMGRRAEGHVFMASKWVFPGGRIDRADFRAPAATELKPETAELLQRGKVLPARARALAAAAIRETFEETGLLMAREVPPRPATGPWRAFLDRGVAPDLAAVDFVARAVTPPGRPRRFDARFFLADAESLQSLDPDTGDRELDEIGWIALSETKDFDLPAITRFVLKTVRERIEDPSRPAPYVRMVGGQHVVGTL